MDFEAVPKSKASVHEFETTRKEGSKHVSNCPAHLVPFWFAKVWPPERRVLVIANDVVKKTAEGPAGGNHDNDRFCSHEQAAMKQRFNSVSSGQNEYFP